MAKSAIEKRETAAAPRVEVLKVAKSPSFPAGKMLISSPKEIAAAVARIPKGKVLAVDVLRRQLARAHRADYTCPLTTGIFLRVAAEATEEEGATRTLPYWRVVAADGTLLDKLPGGAEAQARRLEKEGVALFRTAKSTRVMDLEGCGWAMPPLGKASLR